MWLIPAVDLRAGRVVRAGSGARATYPPLRSRLCPSAEPIAVVGALLRLYPFQVIYLADLDALEGASPDPVPARLARRFPCVMFWLDAGRCTDKVVRRHGPHNLRPVYGSETGMGVPEVAVLPPAAVLSLDFQGTRLLGDADLYAHPACWPHRVILMDLGRTGRRCGVDRLRIQRMRRKVGAARELYVAGGVRHMHDLYVLAALNVHGALVATAVHSGRLDAGQLHRLSRRSTAGAARLQMRPTRRRRRLM